MSSPLLGAPGADNSVRPAREPDLAAIGAVQAHTWTGPYAQVLPPSLVAALTPDVLAGAWRPAVTEPPTARHRVHVAVGDGIVAGFVASAPLPMELVTEADVQSAAVDPPLAGSAAQVMEIVALEVDPLHQRRGHGSRLLAAVVDTARAEGVTGLHVWVHVDDAPRAAFFRGAGFDTDGARRRRALPGADEASDDHRGVWPEVRLVASLDGDTDPQT